MKFPLSIPTCVSSEVMFTPQNETIVRSRFVVRKIGCGDTSLWVYCLCARLTVTNDVPQRVMLETELFCK